MQSCGLRQVRAPRWLIAVVLCGVLAGCDNFNQPSEPCPEISEAEFESALSAGETRGDIQLSADGVLSATIGGSLKTCRRAQGAIGGEVCRRSRDLVVRYATPQRGTFFVKVPSGRWHRFEARNSPGACRLLPG
jgi:hypothetical protein